MEVAIVIGFPEKFWDSINCGRKDLRKYIMVEEFGITLGNIKLFVLNIDGQR